MPFNTDIAVLNGCPEITVNNQSEYESTGLFQINNFTDYQLVNITGLASEFSAEIDFITGDTKFTAPDCPNVLMVSFLQVPTYDFDSIGDMLEGDVVYDPVSELFYEANTDAPGDLYEQPGDWDEISADDIGEKYKATKYILTYCKASDVFDDKFFNALHEISCLDIECCEELPCEDGVIDSLKIAVLAFDTYFVQGQLGQPVLHTDTFLQTFKDNLELFKSITNMKCDGLYSE